MVEIKKRILYLNNKTRKGQYLYITDGTTKKYYKLNKKEDLDQKIQQFKKEITQKKQQKKPKIQKTHKIKTYINKIKQKPTIKQAIHKGITMQTIKNINTLTNHQTQQIKKNLLNELVKDKQLLDILATEENFKKLKTRLEYRITIQDKHGNTLVTANKFNDETDKTIEQLKQLSKKPINVTKKSPKIQDTILKQIGYQTITTLKEGTSQNISLTIIFRKG